MKRLFIIISLVFGALLMCVGGVIYANSYAPTIPERLEYDISYGFFEVGTSSMETLNNIDGTVSIITRAHSNDWMDKLYPVDDYAEAVLEDFDSLRPIKYTLKTREGKGRKHREVFFDHQQNKATYNDYLKDITHDYDIPDEVFDPLAAFYYTRRVPLVPGQSASVPMFDSRKAWDLEVKVIKRDKIKVPAGTFDTVLISPVMQSEGIFSRTGDMYIWVTDDERRIPVLIKSKVLVGSIKVKLTGGSY